MPQNTYSHLKFSKSWDINNTTYFRLGQCEAIIRAISNTAIQPDYREHLLRVSLIKGAQATTAIEGNTLTEDEIKKLQAGEKLPPSKEYQGIEVQNVIDALNELAKELLIDRKESLITPELIKRFHYIIGKNLGEHLQAIPGEFRNNNVTVGKYRPPDYQDVPLLADKLCEWLQKDFSYTTNKQNFTDAVIEAIVTHVYIAWIHPFGDGNGRTARLLEFYILMRGGNPDIASHILSNFYNETRPEYYRQFDNSTKTGDITSFINYAVQGYRDGLNEVLRIVQRNQFEISWSNYIYDIFAEKRYGSKQVFKRRRELMLNFPIGKKLDLNEIIESAPKILRAYASISQRTLIRDLKELEELELVKKIDNKYRANTDILWSFAALRKEQV